VRDWGQLVPELPRVALSAGLIRSLIQGQRRALGDAWAAWKCAGIELKSSHVVYHAEGSQESLGVLKVVADGGFDFALNIAQHLRN
jgi:hypothetical protein